MATNKTQSIPQGQFLTMAANLLHKAFVDSSRTQAKNIYKEVVTGKEVPLTNVRMEDKSTVRFDLGLDVSEYRGAINFGAFRASLGMLIASLGDRLSKSEEVTVFSSKDDPNMMIFGVTGVTKEADDPNVLVLGANMSTERPTILLKLMYLDHRQFEVEPEQSA